MVTVSRARAQSSALMRVVDTAGPGDRGQHSSAGQPGDEFPGRGEETEPASGRGGGGAERLQGVSQRRACGAHRATAGARAAQYRHAPFLNEFSSQLGATPLSNTMVAPAASSSRWAMRSWSTIRRQPASSLSRPTLMSSSSVTSIAFRPPAAGGHVPPSLTARDGPADSSIMAHRGNRATGFYPFQVRSQTVSNFTKKLGPRRTRSTLDSAGLRRPQPCAVVVAVLLAAATAQTWSRCDPDQACGRRRLRRMRSVIPFGVLAAVPVASCVPATGPAVEVASWGRR